MAATDEQIQELRDYVDEPDETNYTNDKLKVWIERYPVPDLLGTRARIIRYTSRPPEVSANPNWIPTYDLHRVAAKIWLKKAGKVAKDFQYSADTASYSRDQVHAQYMQQYRTHMSQRVPTSRSMTPPRRVGSRDAGNLGEMYDVDQYEVL